MPEQTTKVRDKLADLVDLKMTVKSWDEWVLFTGDDDDVVREVVAPNTPGAIHLRYDSGEVTYYGNVYAVLMTSRDWNAAESGPVIRRFLVSALVRRIRQAMPRGQRVRLSRVKGWRLPPNTVACAKPGKWGNPVDWRSFPTRTVDIDGNVWPVSDAQRREQAAAAFRAVMLYEGGLPHYPRYHQIIRELAGKDLACWCPLDRACHVDTLLDIAAGMKTKGLAA